MISNTKTQVQQLIRETHQAIKNLEIRPRIGEYWLPDINRKHWQETAGIMNKTLAQLKKLHVEIPPEGISIEWEGTENSYGRNPRSPEEEIPIPLAEFAQSWGVDLEEGVKEPAEQKG